VTAREALAEAERRLAAAGVETPRVDAEWLVAHLLGTTRSGLAARLDDDVEGLEPLLERREMREPLAYILGEWGFRRLTLRTDRRALIPRPETEVVVERALEHIRGIEQPKVLDVGTGTGAIALAIADEVRDAQVTAIDVSPDALALARENLELTGINGRVRLVEHDLTVGLGNADFDLVVSNPPYVDPEELEALQPEVRDWEPHGALFGGVDGIEFYQRLFSDCPEYLKTGGHLVIEIGYGQLGAIESMVAGSPSLKLVEVTNDLQGIPRTLTMTKS